MWKVALLITQVISSLSLASTSNEMPTSLVWSDQTGGSAQIKLEGPVTKSFSMDVCNQWDFKDGCGTTPYDDTICTCVGSEHRVYYYKSWTATGVKELEGFRADLNFELKQHNGNQYSGGTQSGTINKIKYVANFWSDDEPSKNMSIHLQRQPIDGSYSDSIFDKFNCFKK